MRCRFADKRVGLFDGLGIGRVETNDSETTIHNIVIGVTETGSAGNSVSVASQSTHIGQARFGVNAGVNLGKINPYAKITGVYDFTKTKVNVAPTQASPSQDDFGADFTVGVNLRAKNFTGTLEGYTSQFRDNWTEYGGTVRLRIDF